MKAALCFFWALSLATVSSAWPQNQAATSRDIQRPALESSHEYSPAHYPFPDVILPSLETSFSPRLAIVKRDNNAEKPPSHCLRAREFPAEFDTLAISLKLANVDWAGTSSDVTISVTVNDKGKVPVFKGNVSPSVNAHQTISLKSADYFGAEKINLTDLKVLKIYAYHNGHIFDAFEGLQFNLEARRRLRNRAKSGTLRTISGTPASLERRVHMVTNFGVSEERLLSQPVYFDGLFVRYRTLASGLVARLRQLPRYVWA
ncbi:unnamed protein product [Aspergillus oryzae RIB40]|uniref:DNA, SC023 n=1 Tax=Aspergillus oryzae (strain ATCC 42149 / RIB 40) TaxID=510516 RepID=Q2UHS9_ASPOR|nr:unnamed protein product [Aspergillus oryzae RIB40]BAE58886.1 unnamed protein product [Aspergillus oryzae RIB40]